MIEDARQKADLAMASNPAFTINQRVFGTMVTEAATKARFVEGVRLAGLPERPRLLIAEQGFSS